MTHKPDFDQFLKVLHREKPDYVPFYEHLADIPIIESILGRKCSPLHPTKRKEEQHMQFFVDFYHKLGFDCLPLEFGLSLFTLGGNMLDGRGWADHSRATISNMEEFDEYPWPEPEEAINYKLIDAVGKILPEGMMMVSGVAGGVQEHVINLLGLKTLSVALRCDPKFVAKMFAKIGDLILGVDKIIAEKEFVGALRMGDDMGYKTATLLNPKTVREFVMPNQKRIADMAHSHGKPFILHSCGNLAEIIDELIDFVGIDGWHSFQDLILPVTEAKQKFGDRVALLGGVDLDKLCRANPIELEDYCKNILDVCQVGGGFAFGTGNSVANYIPVEKYLQMLEFGKKYGGRK